jgi:hypothetical protein
MNKRGLRRVSVGARPVRVRHPDATAIIYMTVQKKPHNDRGSDDDDDVYIYIAPLQGAEAKCR